MPQNAAAAGSSMLTRKAHVSHQIASRFLAHLILAARLMVSLAVCICDQVWLEPRDMNFNFRLSLKAKEALLRRGFLRR